MRQLATLDIRTTKQPAEVDHLDFEQSRLPHLLPPFRLTERAGPGFHSGYALHYFGNLYFGNQAAKA
jgi:hypothetical protein